MPVPEVTSKDTEAVNLFRFVNIADPLAKPAKPNSKFNFLENANAGDSPFVVAVDGAANQAARDAALQAAVNAFDPITSSRDVIAINPGLYAFGEFITKFNNKTTDDQIDAKSADVDLLTEEELDLLWDNLYYQAVTQASTVIADTIIQLLRANAFLIEYAIQSGVGGTPDAETLADNFDKLWRIASAHVVIPFELVSRDSIAGTDGKVDLDIESKGNLLRWNNADIARYNIDRINSVLDEVACAGNKYRVEYTEAYATALNRYTKGGNFLSGVTKGGISLDTPFVFKFREPLDANFMETNLSGEALAVIDSLHCKTQKSWEDLTESLLIKRNQYYKLLFRSAPKPNGKIMFGDIAIPLVTRAEANSFVITDELIPGSDSEYRLFLTHYFSSPETATVELEVTVTGGDLAGPATSSSHEPVSRGANHVTFLLFETGLPASTSAYSMNIDFTVEDVVFSGTLSALSVRLRRATYGRFPITNTQYDTIPGNQDVPLYGVKHVGVLEYKRVEQTICCYVAGEVSHIENIMAREYKEKATRNLTRSEITQEDTKEKESENLRDTTTTDRYEMQKEISQVLQEDQSRQISANAGLNAKYGDVSLSASAGLNFSNGSSQTNSFNISESYAKDVTERALSRIVDKTTSKRTSRMLREFEETDKHGFDNRLGDKHVTGIYRWVDKIYENKLVNYGQRLLYDFMIPEPSKNFKYWMTKKEDTDSNASNIKAPTPLSTFFISKWQDVTRDNYANAAGEYGADVDTCPAATLSIGKSFAEQLLNKMEGWNEHIGSFAYELDLPDGYECTRYSGVYAHTRSYNADHWGTAAMVKVNNGQFPFATGAGDSANASFWNSFHNDWDTRVSQKMAISVTAFNVASFSLNVVAECGLTQAAEQSWQQATYQAIVAAYNKRLEEFNNAEAASGPQDDQKIDYNFNPAIGRAIEQRELKRLCIELMMAPFGLEIAKDNYVFDSGNNNFDIKRNAAFERHAAYVKFMEEAFSWDLVSYIFYPYYWSNEDDWSTLIKESSSSDYLFQAFLQSGMARVTVPVRAGFDNAVRYFLNTGKLWKLGKVVVGGPQDDMNLSIASLMQPETGFVEGTWKSRVPTALTILQSDSAPLNANGLPCFCEDGTPIATGNNILAGIPDAGSGNGDNNTTSMIGKFKFPKHEDLTANDVGKLVMNDGDGTAKVYQLSDALDEQTGKFIITLASLGDLNDSSGIEITTSGGVYSFNRTTWRAGGSPGSPTAELTLLHDYILTVTGLANLVPTIVSGTLVLEETAMQATTITLDGFPPAGSLEVERVSRPASPIAATGFPLGKLLAIDGSNAIISSEAVQTYTLESAYTVNNDVFNSSFEFNLNTEEELAAAFNNLVIPAANGKVKPIGLTPEVVNGEFIKTYRDQFVGIAIASSGTEVTVMKLSEISYLWQLMRKSIAGGLLGIG